MNFTGAYTQNPRSLKGTGIGVADVLLSKPVSGDLSFVDSTRGIRRTKLGLYAQDTFKMTSKLTLTLGSRYANFLSYPWTEVHDRMYHFAPSLGTVVKVGTNGIPQSGIDGDYNNFGPPGVGAAYELLHNTVFRVADGVSCAAVPLDTTENLASGPPEFISSTFTNNQFDFAGAGPACMHQREGICV